MSTVALQIRGTASVNTEALAQIFTPVRARISAILFVIACDSQVSADNEVIAELSFQSTSQLNINDATGVLIAGHSSLAFGTAVGMNQCAVSFLVNNIDILWEQGQRMYLHVEFLRGTVVHRFKGMIYTSR